MDVCRKMIAYIRQECRTLYLGGPLIRLKSHEKHYDEGAGSRLSSCHRVCLREINLIIAPPVEEIPCFLVVVEKC